jgi:hypothetical protein
MALEPHDRPALDVEDDAIAIIAGCHDRLRACLTSQRQERATVRLMEPGQPLPHLVGMDAAAMDTQHLGCLAGRDWCARELVEVCGPVTAGTNSPCVRKSGKTGIVLVRLLYRAICPAAQPLLRAVFGVVVLVAVLGRRTGVVFRHDSRLQLSVFQRLSHFVPGGDVVG